MKTDIIILGLATLAVMSSCTEICKNEMRMIDYCSYVNPFIGTDGHGHTFPGATRPFGMVQLSPDTDTKGWDWCSGYHYSDSSIIGFSHTHLSGTGRSDLLDILIMPTTGKLQMIPGSEEHPESGYRSSFSHNKEHASPGYYSVVLDDYSILAELTSTAHAGFHQYTFPESSEAHVIIDLYHAYSTDSVIESGISIVNDSLLTGYRRTRGWGMQGEKYFTDQFIYFAAAFSKPFKNAGIVSNDSIFLTEQSKTGSNIKAYVDFTTEEGEKILIKVGISAVDEEGAMNNLIQEIPDWDFSRIMRESKLEWNEHLGSIEIEDAHEDVLTIFYTSLYHSLIAPYQYSDVDGRYRGFDQKIHKVVGFTNYTVFSLWDTFRALHPLLTIIQSERIPGMIKSFQCQYDEYGLLPVWPLWGSETNCMIGYHSIPVIIDAYLKGIQGIDIAFLYDAMKKSALQDDFGLQYLKEYGYIPYDKDDKSVSKTLEYAFDDWCLSQIAYELGKEEDYRYFLKRSEAYKKLFDAEFGLMNGLSSNGEFRRPFDPALSTYGPSDFIEGNSWQYSFFVPHDVQGLVNLHGGPEAFGKKLEELFSVESSNSESKPLDVTGLIGEYAHGNEPSHHVAYLFNYSDKPYLTGYWAGRIMNELYTPLPDGLCGNEDCGQMSAWYVFSALGFYPLNPASGNYELGRPMVKKAHIKAGNKPFTIKAKNLRKNNIYVQQVYLNGKKLNRNYITHKEILDGGELVFEMCKSVQSIKLNN